MNLKKELQKPEAFPFPVSSVELIETHISWVFLAGSIVYKVKKPVKFSFLDFSTLELRKKYCELEVKLNSRLSPEIYLGVVPVGKENAILKFEGSGKPLEYAVKMKRLPADRKMDVLLGENKVTVGQVEEIAEVVAGFHSRVPVVRDARIFSPEHLKELFNDISSVRGVVEDSLGKGREVDELIRRSDSFIEKNTPLLLERQRNGFIRECHADLYSSNVFLLEKPVIFDCVEFSDDFRFTDTGADVGFMAMDLDSFNKPLLSQAFTKRYVEKSGDVQLETLLPFYKCYRANVRAKVAGLRLLQKPPEKEKNSLLNELNKYLELALRYSGQF